MVEWADPFHSLAVLFPVFAISPSKRPVACETSLLPQKKIGRRDFFSQFFSEGGGASVHRLEACSGWFPSSGRKTHAQGLKHSQHTDKHKKESLERKFNAHFAQTINCFTWLPSNLTVRSSPWGGYSHTLPIRVCAAQRGRGFEAPDLERGIHFRGVF